DLRRFLAREPVLARPVGMLGRLLRWAERKPVLAALAGGVLLLVITSLCLVVWGTMLVEQKRIAREGERRRSEELKRAAAASDVARAYLEYEENNVVLARTLLRSVPEGLRGWEWNCLARACKAELQTLRGHKGAVTAVGYSRDGKWLASADDTGEVRLWDG